MKYKKIMVAIDGSDTSNKALKEAIELTQDQKAFLRIIHIADESVIRYANSFGDYETLWDAYREEGEDLLKRVGDIAKKANINFETQLVILKFSEGRLAEKIIEEAQNWQADLLVIGTHGRHGLNRFFLGSVAERALRLATMPILLIRGT